MIPRGSPGRFVAWALVTPLVVAPLVVGTNACESHDAGEVDTAPSHSAAAGSPGGSGQAASGARGSGSTNVSSTGAPSDASMQTQLADSTTGSSGSLDVDSSIGTSSSPADAEGNLDAGGLSVTFPDLAALYEGDFGSPPKLTDTPETTDAPLIGNGDLGVSVIGTIDALTFVLGKNEFWSLADGHLKAMARLSLAIPGMAGASYSMTENIEPAEVTGSFASASDTIKTKSWVQADDTTNNKLVTEIAYTGAAPQDVTVSLAPGDSNTFPSAVGSSADVLTIDVAADSVATVGGQMTRKARVAVRVIGATGSVGAVSDGALHFTLMPGQSYSLVASIVSNLDSATYQAAAVTGVTGLMQTDVDALNARHRAWWGTFYQQSFVEIPNKTIEREYYASLYLLASTSRAGEAAPGLWGAWVMTDPNWNGDYTLNYNYEVPFYAAFPTNHVSLADAYDKPVVDWVPNAQALATLRGFTGAYYRVHIGPLPNGSADTNEWNQKFPGAYAATDILMHYYYTVDPVYATSVYPTLKQIAVFWENYLVWDGTRYVIVDDAQHEGNPYPQTNGVMSLGLVRFLLQGCIDVSTALGVDAAERQVWQDRLSHLSAFPTFTMNNETVFRYTEVGLDWNGGNSIGIQHIYPGSQIGLGSDATLLQTAKNMVDVMGRWSDGNGTNTFYPAAARVGYAPSTILSQLQSWIENNTYPNLHIHTGGGGIENLNTVPSTIDEMLLQSFQGKLRVFADWPADVDARFGDLRAYGAFLVSSDVRSNVVQYVRIVSEAAGSFSLVNPWPASTLHAYRNGADAGTLAGAEVSMPTSAGDVILVGPDGTSYQALVARMSVPLSGD
jgi:alpha-L-fucosidase 2